LKLTIAFREGADMSAASEQFACPAGAKRSLLKSGVQSGGWIQTNLRKRIVTGVPGRRWQQLFDHYAQPYYCCCTFHGMGKSGPCIM